MCVHARNARSHVTLPALRLERRSYRILLLILIFLLLFFPPRWLRIQVVSLHQLISVVVGAYDVSLGFIYFFLSFLLI